MCNNVGSWLLLFKAIARDDCSLVYLPPPHLTRVSVTFALCKLASTINLIYYKLSRKYLVLLLYTTVSTVPLLRGNIKRAFTECRIVIISSPLTCYLSVAVLSNVFREKSNSLALSLGCNEVAQLNYILQFKRIILQKKSKRL